MYPGHEVEPGTRTRIIIVQFSTAHGRWDQG